MDATNLVGYGAVANSPASQKAADRGDMLPGENAYDLDEADAENGLPALWWLGILIMLVVVRLAYEYL
jgi:hypothetical protein